MKSDFSKESIIKKKKDLAGKPAPEFWTPDLEFERSDFPIENKIPQKIIHSSTGRRPPEKSVPVSPRDLPPKVHGWKPPVLRDTVPDQKSSRTEQNFSNRSDAKKTDPLSRDHVIHLSRTKNEIQPQNNDAAAAYLRSLILEHPENTVYLLRNWYYKKFQYGGTGIESVHPHDRIFIILASAGEAIAGKLFKIMSPIERQNFSEILSGNKEFNAQQVHVVRTEFMNTVAGFR